MPRLPHTTRRRGLTLVELLVVISILIILVAVLLPMMQLGSEGRVVREATRQVNAFLAGAQARAIAGGHPVGVMFVRNPNNNAQCFQLAIAKVPPPYSGVEMTSVAQVNIDTSDPSVPPVVTFWSHSSPAAPEEIIPATILPVGSAFQIRLNHRGAWHSGVRISAQECTLLVDHTVLPKSVFLPFAARLPFQIRRPPKPSAAAPLELPVGAYLDLNVSGTGISGTEFAPVFPTSAASPTVDPPIILFGPRGNVEVVYASLGADTSGDGNLDAEEYRTFVPLEPLQLLIGRAADLETPAATSLANLVDNAESLWLSVNPNSGKVHSAESLGMSPDDPALGSLGPDEVRAAMLQVSRRAALTGQSMGGR